MNEHIGKPFDMGRLVSLLMRVTGFRPPAADDATPAVSSLMQPDVPGLDLAGALERLSGVRPLYVRAAKDFSASLGTLFSDLRATLAAGDAGALRMQLHTLKGNAATLGATALSQHAAALEALHKAGFPAGPCAEMLAQLEPLAEAAQASLQQAIALLDAAKPTDGANAGNAVGDFPGGVPGEVPDTASALAGVSRLVALLKVSDMDALLCFAENRSALEALSEPFCQQLDEALQDLDMDKALALCSAQLVA
jgi:HPt (histidine-containing phosphotransfer) domain-containing protein